MSGPGETDTVEGGGGRGVDVLRDQIAYLLDAVPGGQRAPERGVVNAGDAPSLLISPQLRPVLLCLQDRRLPLPKQILKVAASSSASWNSRR